MNAHTEIRAVFLDMDGTLLSHRTNRIPDSAISAIEELRRKGILVFIATGRHIQELKWLKLEDLPVDGWITVNGAYCYNNDKAYYREPLDPKDVRTLVEEIQKDPFPCMFLDESEIFINMDDEEVRKCQDAVHTPMPMIDSAERALGRDIYMVIPYAKDEIWKPVAEKLKHVRATRWTELALDVYPEFCGKDRGIHETCTYYGIDPKQTLAAGDGPNDIALLEACGYKAAMGNGCEEVKQLADYVSTDIDEDGLRNIMIHFGLIGE